MATESKLLAAILAHPDEDTPRLALADFLDEQGAPEQRDRAEFIRLQIADENGGDLPRPPDTSLRTAELLIAHRAAWTPPIPDDFKCHDFHRGFVERVSCDTLRFLEFGEDVCSLAPVRRVHFHGPPDSLAAVGGSPLLGRVRSLSVGEMKPTLAQLLHFLGSPHVRDLFEFVSYLNDHDDAAVAALAKCEKLAGLTHLDLWGNGQITAAGATTVATAPHFRSLRQLKLPSTEIGDAGLAAVASGLPELTTLAAWRCGIGPKGVAALARSNMAARLRSLSLGGNPIGGEGVAALARGAFRDLHDLSISDGGVGPDVAAVLAGSPALAGLRALDIEENPLGPGGGAALFGGGAFPRLWDLNADDCGIGDAGAAAFAAGDGDELRWLSLCDCDIGDKGAIALANSPRLKNLVHLNLYGNRIGDKGAIALANSPYLANVEWVHLRNNRIGEKGAQALAESATFSPGDTLWLHGNKVRRAAQRELEARFPGRLDFTS